MTDIPPKPRFPRLIETRRLIIRPPHPEEAIEANAAIRETYEALHRWMPWSDQMPEVEETESHRARSYANFLDRSDCTVQAILKESGELAVWSGLNRGNPKVPSHEIGYWCRAKFQGQGYVAEVVRALTRDRKSVV